MITNFSPITADDALLAWGMGEIPEEHRQAGAPQPAPLELRLRIAAGESLTREEKALVVELMRRNRDEIGFFLERQARWFLADFAVANVGDVQLDGYWVQRAVTEGWQKPPRTVRDFAEHPHPDAQALTLAGKFEFQKMRGHVILVGAQADRPPWYIAEGSNRLRAIWLAYSRGEPLPQAVRVVLGVHHETGQWKDVELFNALAAIGWTKSSPLLVARDVDEQRPLEQPSIESHESTFNLDRLGLTPTG